MNDLNSKHSILLRSLEGSKILLVDDDPNLILHVKDYLEFVGFIVFIAGNGAEGLRVLEEETPDLIITDVMMPEMDGYSFVERLREDIRSMDIPILFLSAKGQSSDRTRGLRYGADVYMVKPFDPEELISQIKNLVLSRKTKNEILKEMMSHNRSLIECIRELESSLEKLQNENLRLKKNHFQYLDENILTDSSNREIDRLEELSDFFGSTVHSLKGEFMHISTAAKLIEGNESFPENLKGECMIINRSVEYSQILIQRLNNYLSIGKPSIKAVDILELLRRIELLVLPRIRSNIDLEVILEPSLFKDKEWSVHIDLEQTIGVLMELVQNAVNAMYSKGGKIIIYALKSQERVLISVIDNGPGISSLVQENLFYKQISSKHGSGLGLLLSKKVMEHQFGNLELKKSSEKGTEFTVLLPTKDIYAD